MRVIDTSQPFPDDPNSIYWIYNGLDCCVTREVFDATEPLLVLSTRKVYTFEREMQGPAMHLMERGIRVDKSALHAGLDHLIWERAKYEGWLDKLASALWEGGLNPRSPVQLARFFYDVLKLPRQYAFTKGERKLSTNRESLETLLAYRRARPFIKLILAVRDTGKKLDVLRSSIDSDGRMRVSYNVAGTETGRWSSSKNAFGGGLNFQNVTPEMRNIFVADPGYILAYCDLEQAESRVVAYISGDQAYIRACESGDLHTTVAKMVWPVEVKNRDDADKPFYRHFTYRDMAKRGGHLTNYMGTAFTMHRTLHIEQAVASEFQRAYFKAFPGIRAWHRRVSRQIQAEGALETILKRRRTFFGRLRDDATLREAIAYEPQSIVGDLLNMGLLAIWKKLDCVQIQHLQILGQIHDAILLQFKIGSPHVLKWALKEMEIPISTPAGVMTIPAEAKLGYNWRDLAKTYEEAILLPLPNYSDNPLDWIVA